MAPPPLPRKQLEAFRAAYLDAVQAGCIARGEPCGTGKRSAVAEACKRLGITANMAKVRLIALDRKEPGWASPRDAVGFVAPELPSFEGPVEDLLRRRAAEFQRKQQAAAARRWMRFKVKATGPFGLAFVGDPHIEDDGCDMPRLLRDVEILKRTEGLLAVGMGDWTNNWTGRLSRLKGQQGVTDTQAWKLAEWLLRQPFWMLLLRGNHDMWSGAGDPLKWIANGAAPLIDWAAQFEVEGSGVAWRINAAHDFPGSSIWNKLHGPLREAKMSGHDADVYVAAHRHIYAMAEEQDERTGRVSLLLRCRGYKAMDSYAVVNGYGQQQDRGQTMVAVFNPETRGVRGFSDLEEGAEFLTWLRKRGGRRAA